MFEEGSFGELFCRILAFLIIAWIVGRILARLW